MATYNKFQATIENIMEKVHNFQTDQLALALTAAANAPVNTNAVLTDLTQIAYTNLSTRNIVTNSSSQSGGTYKLIVTDWVGTASGGAVATHRYYVVYNDTPTSPADPLICWFDKGANVDLADTETITLDFDGTNGLFSAS